MPEDSCTGGGIDEECGLSETVKKRGTRAELKPHTPEKIMTMMDACRRDLNVTVVQFSNEEGISAAALGAEGRKRGAGDH